MNDELNAWKDLLVLLEEGEKVEWVVFGNWGWSYDDKPALGYGEPEPPPVPLEKRGLLLDAGDAEPLMRGWSFNGGYGSPECYAVRIWTDRRIFWVTQYDGSTSLSSTRRHPEACMPDMPGGG
jgi:hypothetical protein